MNEGAWLQPRFEIPSLVEIKKANFILEKTKEASWSFLSTFYASRQPKPGIPKFGITTYAEQDLLRAMLVFLSSGVDSTIKHLIREALPKVIDLDEGAKINFQQFIKDKITKIRSGQDDAGESFSKDSSIFLARALASASPRDQLIRELLSELCKGSLQSKDAILVAASAFAITRNELATEREWSAVDAAFKTRNSIIHEMDVNINENRVRIRTERREQEMIRHAEALYRVVENFISIVCRKLGASPALVVKKRKSKKNRIIISEP